MPPANTGNERTKSTDVIKTDQRNNGILNIGMLLGLMFKIVTIILIEPIIDDAPAKCILRIPKSTAGPACPLMLLNGGYKVQPVPAPSKNVELTNKYNDQGSNQKLKLLSRGNAISGAPNKTGTIQLPNPPIKNGITKKKIITNPCAVTITLYNWLLPPSTKLPG